MTSSESKNLNVRSSKSREIWSGLSLSHCKMYFDRVFKTRIFLFGRDNQAMVEIDASICRQDVRWNSYQKLDLFRDIARQCQWLLKKSDPAGQQWEMMLICPIGVIQTMGVNFSFPVAKAWVYITNVHWIHDHHPSFQMIICPFFKTKIGPTTSQRAGFYIWILHWLPTTHFV